MTGQTQDRPTLRMVAKEAGVSVATVSYVLSGRHRSHTIKDSTADRVREAATRLGYRRNDAARAIRTGKSDLVLLSLSVLADPWSQAVAETVSAAVSPLGKTALIVADGDWRTVLIRSGAEPRCHLAVEHLLEHHDRVGALTSRTSGFARFDAYVNTLRAAGKPIRDDDIEIFERHPEGAYRAAMSLLSKADRPTALYCTTDFAAIAAVRAAHRLRLDVPRDLAVVGVGNTPEGEHLDPSLSTVGPVGFNEALARIIVGRLTDREGAPGKVFDFPWQLIVRDSSRPDVPAEG